MALVKCKDCGKDISSDAVNCPLCGADQLTFIWRLISQRDVLDLFGCVVLGVALVAVLTWLFS